VGAAAGDVLGRRTAARQHRPRFHIGSAAASARRTDRLARRGNRAVVVDLVAEKKRRGTAVVAIVHDDDVRAAIADTVIDVNRFTAAA
jgi:hypothetical protein